MQVLNVHERELKADPLEIGALIDPLSSKEDRLWPKHVWPPLKFDRPLAIGASGGHGPIRYFVEEYTPGQSVRFRFTGPRGFDGFHGYRIVAGPQRSVVLRHTLWMSTHGAAILSWPLVFRPMHDALIADSFATAQASLGLAPAIRPWSLWVKMLRWIASGGRARSRVAPKNA